MNNRLIYKSGIPDKSLEHFVDKFWSLQSPSENGFEGIIMPDGNIDLLFIKNKQNRFKIQLTGLETKPKVNLPSQNAQLLGISFKPLAVEYILHTPIADISNTVKILPVNFWDFNPDYFNDFDAFCEYSIKRTKSIKLVYPTCFKSSKKFDISRVPATKATFGWLL